MEGRLVELEAMGIPRPPAVPMFYRIAAARTTTASCIEVLGKRTTGEAEFVLLQRNGRLWVGLGSDHTDREIEAKDAALSKQACDKPIGTEFWLLDDIEAHWDALRLRSQVTDAAGVRTVYQEGSVAAMLHPRDVARRWRAAAGESVCGLLFCGTLPTIGSIRSASRFEVELEDPVLKRRINRNYDVTELPSYLPVPTQMAPAWMAAWTDPGAVR